MDKIIPNITNVRRIYKKIALERNKGVENEYAVLSDAEVECFFMFAYGDYLPLGKFTYQDAQSPCQYIDSLLVYEFIINRLEKKGKIKEAIHWWFNIIKIKYPYIREFQGKRVYVSSEGLWYVENPNVHDGNIIHLGTKTPQKGITKPREIHRIANFEVDWFADFRVSNNKNNDNAKLLDKGVF